MSHSHPMPRASEMRRPALIVTPEKTPLAGFTTDRRSLPEVHGTVPVPSGFWRKVFAFAGPGYLVAVGYMDPGNWATDIAGGARYGYTLLSVVMISNLMAILLQAMAARLGIASGRDLAQACRDSYSRPVVLALWVLAELAIAATDLAEVLGAAIALNLLFGLPILVGVVLTAFDVLVVLYLQQRRFRYVEVLVVLLILGIAGAFTVELWLSRPAFGEVLAGFIPTSRILLDKDMLYIALGILGATVMPHNLYLHSSIVQTRRYGDGDEDRASAIRFATLDSTVALSSALFINAAILIVAAATFHGTGYQHIADIDDAYVMLTPLLGTTLASTLFALALLFAGQNATITGTLSGQIVMEGFLSLRLRPWLRRVITRLIAIVPAVVVIAWYGESGTGPLLILSQVVLSLQLPFAVFPLLQFTSDRRQDGPVRPAALDACARLARGGRHRGAERLAPVPDDRRPVRRIIRSLAVYQRILVAIEHSPADETILAHVQPLARLTQARLLLLHVADGWAARAYDELQLRESEEMRDDREYLERLAAGLRTAGFETEWRLERGDPATADHPHGGGGARRPRGHGDARAPAAQGPGARDDGESGATRARGSGAAAAGAIAAVQQGCCPATRA